VGEAGGGMVKVVMNGRHEVRRVDIDPTVAAADREMLEDLVAAACNDATRRVGEAVQQHMAGAMGGMQLRWLRAHESRNRNYGPSGQYYM
jgi:hypothetical protein